MVIKWLKKIPLLPLSALIFYVCVFILWTINVIPPPSGIVLFLENLYSSYGLIGLFIASFLEGIIYLGLYFPGSFIVALAVFLSDGTFISLISIALVVALAVTITSIINYILGRYVISRRNKHFRKSKVASKGLFLSMLHPNFLAFYFFNEGIEKRNPLKILLVPIIMVPYGLLLAYILYFFKSSLKTAVENPYVMISAILIWFTIALILQHKRKVRRMVNQIERVLSFRELWSFSPLLLSIGSFFKFLLTFWANFIFYILKK